MVYLKSVVSAIGSVALLSLPAASGQRYMPFGDSITEFGCWRAEVWQMLQDAGYTAVDFVGSQSSATQCNGLNYDRDHEGHAGFLAINIANQNQLVGWLQQNPADVITMHLGTNDIFGGHSTDEIIAAFDTLVDQMRDSNPAMRIIVRPQGVFFLSFLIFSFIIIIIIILFILVPLSLLPWSLVRAMVLV